MSTNNQNASNTGVHPNGVSQASPTSTKQRKKKKAEPAGSTSTWVITLFGTAVGAGILFLPINAGSFGFIPLLFATIIAFPLVYYSHRTYARIVSGAPEKDHGKDVLELCTQYLGRRGGVAIAILYWISVFSTVLIYGVSITNAVDSFIVHQMGGPSINRWVLATLCVGLMTAGFAFGRKPMLWLAQMLVYPLIGFLAITSIYLIPRWDISSFLEFEYGDGGFLSVVKGVLLILPVMVFAFSHMAALSQLSVDMQPAYGKNTEKRVSKIEFYTAILLVVFTMVFVWSCVLALGADGMREAHEQNIPVLSYFANVTGTPIMAAIAPMVVVCAIVSSYFGHLLGSEEGTEYLFKTVAPKTAERIPRRNLLIGIYVFAFVTTTLVAVFNPSIVTLASLVAGVFVVFMVYLLPVYMFRNLDVYKHFRKDKANYFVLGLGVVIMLITIWDLF